MVHFILSNFDDLEIVTECFNLLNKFFEQLSKKGFEKGYLWVIKDNPTIKFYEKTGGKLSGETMVEIFKLLKKKFPHVEFKLATIFYKKTALIQPDFAVKEATQWIEFFWEKDIKL